MAKMSVQVQNWSASATHVVSSLDEHGELLVQGALAQNELLPAAQRISEEVIRAFVRWVADLLQHKTSSMVAAEMAYIDEQADDPAVRLRRDEAMSPLSVCLTHARTSISSLLGEAGLATYGMTQQVPRTAAELADYARVAHGLLLKYPRQEPDPIGGTFNTGTIANSIGTLLTPLDEALRDLRTEHRQLEGAMLHRDAEVSGWREIYVNGATILSALYRMTGHPGIAARVRPTARRTDGRLPGSGDELPGDGVTLPEDPADPTTPPAATP